MSAQKQPSLYIPRIVFQKIMHWINKAPGEVGGMGTIQYDAKGNFFWVVDAFLVEQEVTAGTTELNSIALGKLEYELQKNKVDGNLNFWWHSHANFGVFWSTDDRDTINQLGERGYCVATVLNKKQEMRSAVCALAKTPYGAKTTLFMDELTTTIYDYLPDDEVVVGWDKDFEAKVKEKTYKPQPLPEGKTSAFKRSDRTNVNFKWDMSKWTVPTATILTTKLSNWRQHDLTIGLDPKGHEFLLMAAATNMHPETFNLCCMEFTEQEWDKLEEITDSFFLTNPDFVWSENVHQ